MSPPALARLQVLAAALLFSTGGPVIKASQLTPWQIAGARSAVAAVVVLVLMPSARRALGGRSLVVGIAFGATMVLYVLANRMTTAANAIFLQDTAPLYVMLLAPWLLGERARLRDGLAMLVLGGGLVLILLGGETASATAPDPVRGNVLGACAGLSWALTVLGLRWLGRGDGRGGDGRGAGQGHAAVAAGNLLAVLFVLPMALPLVAWSLYDLGVVIYLGGAQIVLAYVLLNAGMRHLAAFEASLLLLLEPVASTALGALVHGERPAALSLAGAALILLATAVKTGLDLAARPRAAVVASRLAAVEAASKEAGGA